MRKLNLTIVFFVLVCASCVAAQHTPSNENTFISVKEKFISSVTSGWDSYSICEYRDRSDQYSYLRLLIPTNDLLLRGTVEDWHFVVRQQTDSSGPDLSIYRIQYASDEEARNVFDRIWTSEATGTVADGKVLTRYAARIMGPQIWVLRTQSYLDPVVKSFLDSFTKEASSTDD